MRNLIRIFSLWILPLLVFILISLAGFIWWCFASQTGTKWLLQTAVSQFDGQANGIKGSLRKGLFVDNLNIDLPEAKANLFGLHLKVVWSELFKNKRLHINDISLDYLDLDIYSSDDSDTDDTDDFSMPVLPVEIQLDRLALGGLSLNIDDEPLPVELLAIDTSFALNKESAQLIINQMQLAKDNLLVQLQADVDLDELAKPWPFKLNLQSKLQDSSESSMLCSATWLELNDDQTDCQLDIKAVASGSLDSVDLNIQAHGTDINLDAKSILYPGLAFPLGASAVDLHLSNNAGLALKIDPGEAKPDGSHLVSIDLLVNSLGLNHWLPVDLKESELNLKADIKTSITAVQEINFVALDLEFLEHSKWNGKNLLGHLKLDKIYNQSGFLWPVNDNTNTDSKGYEQESAINLVVDDAYPLDKLVLNGLDIDLNLDSAKVYAAGDLAAKDSKLALNVDIPRLDLAWPGIPGGVSLNTVIFGNLALFNGGIQGRYVFDDANATDLLEAPVDLQLSFTGSLNDKSELHAEFSNLAVTHAKAKVSSLNTINFDLNSDTSWLLANAQLALNLDDENLLNLNLEQAGGHEQSWYTKGVINNFSINANKIKRIQKWLDAEQEDRGIITSNQQLAEDELELGLNWDLKFEQVLTGDIDLKRIRGDVTVPTDIPVKLGLKEANLNIQFKPRDKTSSLIAADLGLETHKMGSLRLRADMPLHILPDGGFNINEYDQKNFQLQAQSEDLAWINLFLDGAQEIGGNITADIKGKSLANGGWSLTGPLTGADLSFVIPDQGVRLLDGELVAHFDNMQLSLDKLYFPAKQRVIPQDSRVASWLADDPDAQDGYLNISGQVNLEKQEGLVKVDLHRYPVVQRSDRYVMLSGDLDIDLAMPSIVILGDLTVDTGWFDIDMLSDIPELSSDVIILKRGETLPESEPSLLDINADINIDMGKRFYVTGFGLDTGVVGNLAIHLTDNKMRALGALRTRGGEIKAYGQDLKLRRGTITFQGDISNPVLDIEALRTDVAVQAGVGISGTARSPKINLVSYPDVSETEKLTWLLLGHGPDEGGAGDMSLLFSVGSSFLSGGEPFYKRFGLDELSMRSGQLGSTGSILPVETVVSDMDAGASPIEQRFLVASKQLSAKTRLSLEQALAQTGTVARLSYKLMWRLTSEVTVGTTNGLALVYRWFSRD